MAAASRIRRYTENARIVTNNLGTMDISGFCDATLAKGNAKIKDDSPINTLAKNPSNHELNRKHSAKVTSNSTVAPAIGKPRVMALSSKVATKIAASITAYFAT